MALGDGAPERRFECQFQEQRQRRSGEMRRHRTILCPSTSPSSSVPADNAVDPTSQGRPPSLPR